MLLQGIAELGVLQTISCKILQKIFTSPHLFSQGYLCYMSASPATTELRNQNSGDARVRKLLTKFGDVFQEPTDLPPSRNHDHRIPLLEGSQPVNQRGYRVPYVQKMEIKKKITELPHSGFIQCSTSPFASPIILVKKKDDSCRMCVDYRRLNDINVKNKSHFNY